MLNNKFQLISSRFMFEIFLKKTFPIKSFDRLYIGIHVIPKIGKIYVNDSK